MLPKALKVGGRVAVVSPASSAKESLVEAGMTALRTMGYEPVLFPSALAKGPLYYAGTAAERAADLHAAFADKSIDAVICTRGGWGSAELLPLLKPEIFIENPKPFVGYSDHSALHIWLQQVAGLVSFHGPMVSADFARDNGVDRASWTSALCESAAWSLTTGMRVMQSGTAKGVLRGGCLSILVESLATPWAFQTEGSVLFLEDIGHKAYQWDRQLLHLRYAGLLDGVEGIVFGDMAQCVRSEGEREHLEKVLEYALRGFKGPVAIGLPSGHVDGANITLPLGVDVELSVSEQASLRFLGAAVR